MQVNMALLDLWNEVPICFYCTSDIQIIRVDVADVRQILW
jgi:hypothetical protein